MLFADDIVLCSTRRDHVERKLEEWRRAMEERGMKIRNEREDQGKVYRTVVRPALMYGAETWALKKAHEKQLEVAEMRMLRWMCEVTSRTPMVKIKGNVYRTVVRPALMYGAETWALKEAQEKKLEVAEMRMLRWMCEVTSRTPMVKIKGNVYRTVARPALMYGAEPWAMKKAH